MINVTNDQHFPRNPNYNDPGVLGGGAKEPYIEETYDADGYLTSVVMHGYTKVPSYKFSNDGKLQTFVDYGTTIKSIEKYAFSGCTSLALTSLPNSITSIQRDAFNGCTSLALTSLPDGITSIGTKTFYDCTSLALTSLPNGLTIISDYAFMNCTSLALTSLPSGLTDIPNYAFMNCNGLVSMSIHSGINAISLAAFGKCGGLTSVTFEGKPSGNMAKNIFQGCINLTEIKVPWAEGEVANAPWGATNATITYNYTGE